MADALADLAVTGRESYRKLKRNGVALAALDAKVRDQLSDATVAPTAAEVQLAIDQALDRAYRTAWAVRSHGDKRRLRSQLGWIAVSAEDDTPHRPVNLPSPPYQQHDIAISTGGFAISTRFFIASPDEPPPTVVQPQARTLPDDPEPHIPDDHEVILFLHGHSSGAEEALSLIPPLLEEGLRRGKKYAIVSVDLPNNGYSETFDHRTVAPLNATDFPVLLSDMKPISTPILTYIENFVVAFVTKLYRTTKTKARFAAVIGGSLGGNLALRLGRRDLGDTPWLGGGSGGVVVAWSPASVWKPMVQHGTADVWT